MAAWVTGNQAHGQGHLLCFGELNEARSPKAEAPRVEEAIDGQCYSGRRTWVCGDLGGY
jgi:hypothetical protein